MLPQGSRTGSPLGMLTYMCRLYSTSHLSALPDRHLASANAVGATGLGQQMERQAKKAAIDGSKLLLVVFLAYRGIKMQFMNVVFMKGMEMREKMEHDKALRAIRLKFAAPLYNAVNTACVRIETLLDCTKDGFFPVRSNGFAAV